LRRAYCDGKLLKATIGRLISLKRVRTQDEVQLVRHELTRGEESLFMSRMDERLRDFADLLDADLFDVVGQVPAGADVVNRVKKFLAASDKRQIAAKPNA
jgi:hypothetical protein